MADSQDDRERSERSFSESEEAGKVGVREPASKAREGWRGGAKGGKMLHDSVLNEAERQRSPRVRAPRLITRIRRNRSRDS